MRVFDSITFRAVLGVSIAFFLTIIAGRYFIAWMRKIRATEDVEKPDSSTLNQLHASKKGTPTMGGLMVVFAILVTGLLTCDPTNPLVLISLGVTLAFGALGFVDDYMKLKGIGQQGFGKKQKILLQCILAALTVGALAWCAECNLYRSVVPGSAGLVAVGCKPTMLVVPFTKFEIFSPDLGWLFWIFAVLVIVACSNAVNLTDGLDGLASGCTIMVTTTYLVFAYIVGNVKMCEFFRIPHIPGSGELSIICAIMGGAVMGFLWFNAHPAKVFLGDTGSLSLGANIALIALITKHELVLAIAGGIFVIEAASVLLQMLAFRFTGRRIFKCAPFHHHLEFSGWHENHVVVRMWIVGVIFAVMALGTLKMH